MPSPHLSGQFSGRRFACAAILAALVTILTAPLSQAQISGTISGTVTDQTGALVSNAKVTLINEASQSRRESVSNSTGYFSFTAVLPSTYTLSVEMQGFKTWQKRGISVHPGDTLNQSDIKLQVGQTVENVTVEATAMGVEPQSSGERSSTLTAKQIDLLPLAGRNMSELLKVLPGVATGAGTASISNGGGGNGVPINFLNVGAQGSAIGNGLAPNGVPNRGGTALLFDGANIIDPGCNCWSVATVNPDMTQEVTVQTSNFGADSAKGPVVVNNIGKSGTATYHGQGYFYARNGDLNAIDWQTLYTAKNQGKEPQKGLDHYYYPGFSFGGPVPFTHKKLLFWFGYEHFIQNTGAASLLTSIIPTAGMMGGNFTAAGQGNSALCPNLDANGNNTDASSTHSGTLCGSVNGTILPDGTTVTNGIIPSQFLDKGSAALASFWPAANITASGIAGNNWEQALPSTHDGYIYRMRFDYDLSDKDKFFVSYQYGNDNQLAQGNGAHIWWTPQNAIPFPGGGIQSQAFSKVLTGHFLHVFGPTLTNEVIASWGWGNAPLGSPNFKAVTRSALNYPYSGTVFGAGAAMIPSYNSAGAGTFPDFSQADVFEGPGGGQFIVRKETPSLSDNLTKVWRSHTIKAGFFWERSGNYQGNYLFPNGSFSFGSQNPNIITGQQMGSANNPTANFIMGVASGYQENNSNPYNDIAYKTISFYGDDSWKVLPRLTVELGLRFDHIGRWYDRSGVGIAAFYPNLVQSDFNSNDLYPGMRWHAIDHSVPLSGSPSRALYVSPRFGLAWDVRGDGKTVVRGGWGAYRFNDQYNDFANALAAGQNVQSYNLPGSHTVLLSQLGSLAPPAQVWTPSNNPSLTAVSPTNDEIPLTYSWNLTISQRLPWQSLLEVAYVGNSSSNLLMGGGSGATVSAGDFPNVNKMPLGALFKPDPVTGIMAPNPEDVTHDLGGNSLPNKYSDYQPFGYAYGTGVITVPVNVGYSNYNAMQWSWLKQTGRLNFNLNYTWSKTLGTALEENPFVLHGNYGVLGIDRPHVINTSFSYNLPDFYQGGSRFLNGAVGGWTVAAITTWQAGGNLQALYSSQSPNLGLGLNYTNTPANVSSSLTNATFFGTTAGFGTSSGLSVMPNYPCNPGSGLANNQRANVACFSLPSFTGNSVIDNGPRNLPYLSGPSYFDSDLALYKTFHVTERQSIQFRASAFNWLNHPLPIFSNGGLLQLKYSVDYQTHQLASSMPSNWGFLDQKAGAPNQRIFEFSAKYSF